MKHSHHNVRDNKREVRIRIFMMICDYVYVTILVLSHYYCYYRSNCFSHWCFILCKMQGILWFSLIVSIFPSQNLLSPSAGVSWPISFANPHRCNYSCLAWCVLQGWQPGVGDPAHIPTWFSGRTLPATVSKPPQTGIHKRVNDLLQFSSRTLSNI